MREMLACLIVDRSDFIVPEAMPQRLAAIMAMIAFAVCLVVGSMGAGNSFDTAVARALLAMVVTFVIGLIVGTMGQKMLEENLRAHEEKIRNQESKVESSDR